jgi:tryptophan-rich sensory protein
MRKRNWKALMASFAIAFFAALAGSLFTSASVKSGWYNSIKPGITPPSFVFPIAWTILFFLIALSLYFAWMGSNQQERKTVKLVFGINLALNILWSVFFFGMRNPALAFCEIIVLWFSILVMILATRKISRKSSRLLWPYLMWVAFAAILNFLSAF